MKPIVRAPGGLVWQEMETQEEADRASAQSGTRIGDIFKWERAAGGRGRYVQLTDATGTDLVWGRLPCGGTWERGRSVTVLGGPIFTRPLRMPLLFSANSADPFPAYRALIEVLGAMLGVSIKESSYLFGAQPPATSEDNTDSPEPRLP